MPKSYCVYGDNIVECERMIKLIADAVSPTKVHAFGNPMVPQYNFVARDVQFTVTTFPGFGRWKHDIIKCVRENGGVLREVPDIILTESTDGAETPILAIEFCSALPAGNQAWQRSGRAYSTARSNIPYVFLTEIGGYELDADRRKNAPRMQNPAIPFSYLAYSILSDAEITIAYQMNPGADNANRVHYAQSICGRDFAHYLRAFLSAAIVPAVSRRCNPIC